MIKFKQKEYSIDEGHYTGPKDMEKTPSTISVLAKSAGIGAGVGAIVGKIAGIKSEDITVLSGAAEGAKYGTLSGIALKIFLNYLHKPMKSVKYQEVDKVLRREFGVYRVSGITVGDSIGKRASIDEKFGFNDRNVTSYKITFCVSDNKVTMYTLGLSEGELERTDKVLDYYCKKFVGMEYSSVAINRKSNSYAVTITFTNYPAISSLILELSESLETRINLINNDILAGRIVESVDEEDSRNFSFADSFGRNDVLSVLSKSVAKFFQVSFRHGLGESLSHLIISIITGVVETIGERELAKSQIPVPRFMFSNDYLKDALTKLKYIEGFHYTTREKGADSNISLVNGIFLVTTKKGDSSDKIDKEFWSKIKMGVNRSVVNNNVVVYNYSIKSRSEFNDYLNLLMRTGIKFNIFEQ